MQITWLGHSGFRIEIEEAVLLVDPWITGNPSFPAGQRWIFQPHDTEYRTDLGAKLNFNLGIGYPF